MTIQKDRGAVPTVPVFSARKRTRRGEIKPRRGSRQGHEGSRDGTKEWYVLQASSFVQAPCPSSLCSESASFASCPNEQSNCHASRKMPLYPMKMGILGIMHRRFGLFSEKKGIMEALYCWFDSFFGKPTVIWVNFQTKPTVIWAVFQTKPMVIWVNFQMNHHGRLSHHGRRKGHPSPGKSQWVRACFWWSDGIFRGTH